jgi:hypothetical protein
MIQLDVVREQMLGSFANLMRAVAREEEGRKTADAEQTRKSVDALAQAYIDSIRRYHQSLQGELVTNSRRRSLAAKPLARWPCGKRMARR